MHEHEIRKQTRMFAFLAQRAVRDAFMGQLGTIMAVSNFVLIACVVDKARLPKGEGAASNPYHMPWCCAWRRCGHFWPRRSRTV